MDPQAQALENLTVIRSLMERATAYRAISASAALLGGALALAGSAIIFWQFVYDNADLLPWQFLAVWLGILCIASLVNLLLLARAAKERGEPVLNRGFKTAFAAVFPPLLVGGVLGIGAALSEAYLATAIIWTCCYGLALLATKSFAPRSIRWLGFSFLLAGLASAILLFVFLHEKASLPHDGNTVLGILLLGGTFGLFHVIYGVAVLMRKKQDVPSPSVTDFA